MITPGQSVGPSVGDFHQITYNFNGKWVVALWNRQAKGPPELAALVCTAKLVLSKAANIVTPQLTWAARACELSTADWP